MPSGPLKFFIADRVQRPSQLIRGSVMLVRKTYSMNFKSAAALGRGTFDKVIGGKL